ncbi:MAG: CHAP domain-containing protein [Methylocystaceae bacterium]|nr:CHAP domain-containing protein [Methylocystaceae bacterium]
MSDNAESKSKGRCAAYVRRALEAGGLDSSGHPRNAKDWGPTLEKNGFVPVNPDNYAPQKGDVVVIQPYPGGNKAGHMAAYSGKQWISDFKQRDMWAGPGYRKHKPPHVIYRKVR